MTVTMREIVIYEIERICDSVSWRFLLPSQYISNEFGNNISLIVPIQISRYNVLSENRVVLHQINSRFPAGMKSPPHSIQRNMSN